MDPGALRPHEGRRSRCQDHLSRIVDVWHDRSGPDGHGVFVPARGSALRAGDLVGHGGPDRQDLRQAGGVL